MALRTNIVALDRLQSELVGDLLSTRHSVQRFIRCVVRRMHPLLHFRLVALRALIGANDRCRIMPRRSTRRLRGESPKCSDADRNYAAHAQPDLTQRRKSAKK